MSETRSSDMTEEKRNDHDNPAMRHREITLADGRYMVFYTFEDPVSGPGSAESRDSSPEAEGQSEGRDV